MKLAAVVIGRNEGERLERCLMSLQGRMSHIVYVDSGSTDGSPELARKFGADVVDLDMSKPFTAARARNAGLAHLNAFDPTHVQFIDGDCELDPQWLVHASAAFDAAPDLAVVCGRRREKFPEASLWNQLIDAEWNTPVGETDACGGDALIRYEALQSVEGYRDDLIAGEEPEMCYRMRQKGWRIRRIDAEMTRHDAALTSFGQWWRRITRGGHAYAEVSALHRGGPERFYQKEVRRALIWGGVLPLVAVLGVLVLSPWFLLILLAWPLQVVRLVLLKNQSLFQAFFLTLAKPAETQGIMIYWLRRMAGRQGKLIEYK